LPKEPSSLADFRPEDFEGGLAMPDGASFLLHDSGAEDPERFLVMGCRRGLSTMARSHRWHVDGTFSIVPKVRIIIFI
jgi:hypothetical protein